MSTIQDILYFKKDQEHINKWDLKKPLFINGTSGTGKSTLAQLIFKKKNISTNYIDSSFIKKGKRVSEYILDILGKCSISMMFSDNSINGIIIDDIDVFDSQDNIISSIYNIIKNNKTTTPFILVSNSKFLSSNIKKIISICHLVETPTPSVQRMCKGDYNKNASTVQRCAQKSKGDWGYFLRLLSITDKSDQLKNIDTKEINGNITNYSDFLMSEPYNIDSLFNRCASDYSLISLLLYTNTQKILLDNNKCIKAVLKSQQLFDIVEKKIEIDWSMISLSILFGCVNPLFSISNINTSKYDTVYTHVFSVSTSQINHRKLLKKVEKETGKSINIVAALLYHTFKNDIAHKQCKKMCLKDFTLNELQKIITVYYKPHKFTAGNKKILNSFL